MNKIQKMLLSSNKEDIYLAINIILNKDILNHYFYSRTNKEVFYLKSLRYTNNRYLVGLRLYKDGFKLRIGYGSIWKEYERI